MDVFRALGLRCTPHLNSYSPLSPTPQVYVPDGVIVRSRRRSESQAVSSIINSRTAFQESNFLNGGFGMAGKVRSLSTRTSCRMRVVV